jgi:hypothetical protein
MLRPKMDVPCEPIGYFLHRRPRWAILPDRSFGAKPTKTDFRGRVLEDPAADRRPLGLSRGGDEDPPRAADAVGLFIQRHLDRTG